MSTKDDGGPAFPAYTSMGEVSWEGMTLRDYFAAKALVGCVSMSRTYSEELDKQKSSAPLDQFIASMAYRLADAMLKARQS